MVNPVTYSNTTGNDDEDLAVVEFLDAYASTEELVGPSWTPGIPTPSPFQVSARSGRILPRAPIRIAPPTAGTNNDNSDPSSSTNADSKIDPRQVRTTEIISAIINDLGASRQLYKGTNGWAIAFIPRRVSGANSFVNEWFFNTDTNRMAYKNADGSVTNY